MAPLIPLPMVDTLLILITSKGNISFKNTNILQSVQVLTQLLAKCWQNKIWDTRFNFATVKFSSIPIFLAIQYNVMNHVSQLYINGYVQNEADFQPTEEAQDEVTKCFFHKTEISTNSLKSLKHWKY